MKVSFADDPDDNEGALTRPLSKTVSDAMARARDDPAVDRNTALRAQIARIDAWPATEKSILGGATWREWSVQTTTERAAQCEGKGSTLWTMDDLAADWMEVDNWTGGEPPMNPDERRLDHRAELMRELEGLPALTPDQLLTRYAADWAEALGLEETKIYSWDELEAEERRRDESSHGVDKRMPDASRGLVMSEFDEEVGRAAQSARTDVVAAAIVVPGMLFPDGQRFSDDYHVNEVRKVRDIALKAIQQSTRDRHSSLGEATSMTPIDNQEVQSRAAEFADSIRRAVEVALIGRRFITPHDWLGPNPEQTPESIWAERPELAHIMKAARTTKLSPWALLGQALTRAAAMIPYYVPFRSFLGSTSVNLLVAVAGSTGTGKTAAESAVADVFRWPVDLGHVLEAGSGEAIPSAYAYAAPKADKEIGIQKGDLVWRHEDHLARFGFDEVGRLNAVQGRQGATVLEYLKSAESGASLGRILASGEGVQLPSKEYRFTATINVQPERAHLITSADEAAGGLPGRMLWVNAEYAPFVGMPRSRERLEPYPLAHLNWTIVQAIDSLPSMDAVFEAQRDAAHAGELDPMESHAALLRAKVACCLMALAGRQGLIESDWDIAGRIMANSRHVRGDVLRNLAGGVQDLDRRELEKLMRVSDVMAKHKAAGLTMAEARKKLASRDRPLWDKTILQREELAW